VECGYPLLDMLRYQKFEEGRLWTTEYGSADKEKQFAYLLKYSPYQNVKKGTAYPAIFFFTGASDTRVDPLHARKMTALLQADSSSGRPMLLHYSVAGGHSAGVSVEQEDSGWNRPAHLSLDGNGTAFLTEVTISRDRSNKRSHAGIAARNLMSPGAAPISRVQNQNACQRRVRSGSALRG
jgi:hypothetical protein